MGTLNRYVVSGADVRIVPLTAAEETAIRAEWAANDAAAAAERAKPPPTPVEKLTKATGMTPDEIKTALGLSVTASPIV